MVSYACCSPVEKGWAWVAPASRRQGEKERERRKGDNAAIVLGGFVPESVCHTLRPDLAFSR
jgi:hypothetical protein